MNRKTSGWIVLLSLSPLLVESSLRAEPCTQLRPGVSPAAAHTVGVFPDPLLPLAVVERALAAWSACSAIAVELPAFEIGEHGTRDLFIEYDPAAIGADERCGAFGGRTITLFGRTRTVHGTVVPCGSLTQNLVHELGHALGLDDSPRTCSSFAMAKLDPRNRFHRRVRRSECRALARRWVRLPAPPSLEPPEWDARVAASSLYP